MTDRRVLIFAKTNHAKTPYDEWLAGTGIQPIIVVAEEFAASYQHMANVHAFGNYDYNPLLEKTAYQLARRYKPMAIFARGEPDIIRAAQLRDLLDLPGQRTASALAYRNKVVMKAHLRAAGVPVPEFRSIESTYTILQFVEQYGYPVVIKPNALSGSRDTHIIHDDDELDRYLAEPHADMEIEKFIDGTMYHVDGLILGGEIALIHPFRYVNGCLAYRNNEFSGAYAIAANDPMYHPLVSAARRIVRTLPATPHMTFHCELFHTPDDQIVLCEIASRTGGAMISSSIRQSFGINVDKEWFFAECGLSRSLPKPQPYQPSGYIIIPPLDGVLEGMPDGNEPPCVRAVELSGVVGQRYHGGTRSGTFVAGYVVNGKCEDEVARNMADAASWFAQNARWQLAG